MRVLFAVNNDNISDAIVKKYQKEYKEIISYKNVYYFNAILKELQNNKNYDSVVISEDLEPFANNNFDTIDKFLFEKLDKISDEATKVNGNNIEIILICADRRNKSDEMLTKIFGIGIYNALIGDDRNIDNLCRLINQPRSKKEAKIAYRIDGTNIGYQAEDENNVSEAEVQNILAHYKRLGKDEDKYVDSFNNIVSQYTDTQLRIIIKYLPMNVKAVLEEKSPKYQELATYSYSENKKSLNTYKPKTTQAEKSQEKINVKMLEKDNITKPIVIPSALKINNTKKVLPDNNGNKVQDTNFNAQKFNTTEDFIEEQEEIDVNEPNKKGRGRPRKIQPIEEIDNKPKKGRGRPRKIQPEEDEIDLFSLEDNNSNKSNEEDTDLFDIIEEEKTNNDILLKKESQNEIDLFDLNENVEKTDAFDLDEDDKEIDLFNLNEDDKEKDVFNLNEDNEETDLFNLNEDEQETDLFDLNGNDEKANINNKDKNEDNTNELFNFDNKNEDENGTFNKEELTVNQKETYGDLNKALTKEKKVVSFVGTTKNGTSFIVNNIAMVLSAMNISTAILDLTQSKNAYYIYTKNEQNLRDIAENSISNLTNGIARGIEVNKNLTVYTELPGKEQENIAAEDVLKTLLENYNVVLIDTDFNTPVEYFEKSQEIYLVQSMDILTIQPLTAFLRMLKAKNILKQEKLKLIINKYQNIKTLSDKILIGGISSYNDPAMSYMTELFDKDKIPYCKIPFEMQNYLKYLDALVDCEISLKGYTKQLINSLNNLAGMVYPLINREKYTPMGNKKDKMEFSDSTKNILNKMKNNY